MTNLTTLTNMPPEKIDSLESLRGLAALAVLLHHLLLGLHPSIMDVPSPPLTQLWHNGAFAVRVFFVLSGFVLSLSYFRRGEISQLRSAAIRRFWRLFVPVVLSSIIAYVLHAAGALRHHQLAELVPGGPSAWLHSFYMSEPSLRSALREACFGAYFDFQYSSSYNVVLWTMEVEYKGSLLVFAMLALCGGLRWRGLVYVAMLFVLDATQARFAFDFIAGMCLCDWHTSRPSNGSAAVWIPLFLLGLLLADLRPDWLTDVGLGALTRGQRLWPTIAALLLVSAAVRQRAICKFLSRRSLVWLGKLSFALYLLHIPIFCSVGAAIYCCLHRIGVRHEVNALSTSAICIVVCLIVSHLGPFLFDPLAIRLGRFAERLLDGTTSVWNSGKFTVLPQMSSGTEKHVHTAGIEVDHRGV